MAFVIKGNAPNGVEVWVKRQAGPYRLGPRDQARVFHDRIEAQRVISQLPAVFHNAGVEFSIERDSGG